MEKKRKNPVFDENLLIGSISGLNKNKEAVSQSEAPKDSLLSEEVSQMDKPNTPLPTETYSQLENKVSPDFEGNDEPVSTPEPSKEESKGKKESKLTPNTKPKGKRWEYENFLKNTPGRKEARAYISEANHNKLRRILAFTDKKIALADYLENVLEEHFEKYEAEIKELHDKYLRS